MTTFRNFQQRVRAQYIELFRPDLAKSFQWSVLLCVEKRVRGRPSQSWSYVTRETWSDFCENMLSGQPQAAETKTYLKVDVAPFGIDALYGSGLLHGTVPDESDRLRRGLYLGTTQLTETGTQDRKVSNSADEGRFGRLLGDAQHLRDAQDEARKDGLARLIREAALMLVEASMVADGR